MEMRERLPTLALFEGVADEVVLALLSGAEAVPTRFAVCGEGGMVGDPATIGRHWAGDRAWRRDVRASSGAAVLPHGVVLNACRSGMLGQAATA